MGAAQLNISVVDRSTVVPALDGMYGIIAMPSNKGDRKPRLYTSQDDLIKKTGEPDPRLGVAQYSALTYLTQANKLWVKRVAHEDCKYSGVLVKGKVDSLPTAIPNYDYKVDMIVSPITGLTQHELDTFNFNLYLTNREYEELTTHTVLLPSTSSEFKINKFELLEVGSKLSFGMNVNDESPLYEIKELKVVTTAYDKLKLTSTVTVSTSDTIRRVFKQVADFLSPVVPAEFTAKDSYTILLNSVLEIEVNQTLVINGVNYIVTSINGSLVSLSTALTTDIDVDAVIKYEKRSYTSFPGITITRDFNGSDEILVNNSDILSNNDIITFEPGLTSRNSEFTIIRKDIYREDSNIVVLDNPVILDNSTVIQLLTKSEFEDRECFLVTNANEGSWGNNLSIAITPSSDYEEAFYILVYDNGVLVESYHVTRKLFLDGFGRQMFLEDVINGKSAYIQVKDNPQYVDDNGEPILPLPTTYSVWRQKHEDYFLDSGATTTEDIILGDTDVRVTDFSNFSLGRRIRFGDYYSAEYKVINKYTVVTPLGAEEFHIVLDREIQDERLALGAVIWYFDGEYNDIPSGIYNGVKNFKLSKLPNVYYNYKLNSSFVISGITGILLDAGANLMTGGFNGSPVTLSDMISAIKEFSNKDEYPGQIILDGGFAHPAYAQAINSVIISRGEYAHAFLSNSLDAELADDYTGATVEYRNSLMLNTANCSLFAGWIKIFDERNQVYVWTSPEAFAAASQSYTTRNYSIFTPAAGYLKGTINGGLDVVRRFSQGDMDYLCDNRINSIRYERGAGLIIWGNETLYVKPSPLQLRSVAFLVIFIKYGLDGFLKYMHFEFNDQATWRAVESAINVFMRDQVLAKRGVYDYKVAVEKVITDSDIDNRKMPVFLGIQPTMDIKMIDARIAIFNKAATISVSW